MNTSAPVLDLRPALRILSCLSSHTFSSMGIRVPMQAREIVIIKRSLNCGPMCPFTDTPLCKLGRYCLQIWEEPLWKLRSHSSAPESWELLGLMWPETALSVFNLNSGGGYSKPLRPELHFPAVDGASDGSGAGSGNFCNQLYSGGPFLSRSAGTSFLGLGWRGRAREGAVEASRRSGAGNLNFYCPVE